MKTMTCKQLGGACEVVFKAETFEEMAEQSKKHGMEMHEKGDKDHIEAMGKMKELMSDPEAMKRWFEGVRKEYERLLDE